MRKGKRLLSILLCLAMVCSLLQAAMAENGEEGQLLFKYSDQGLRDMSQFPTTIGENHDLYFYYGTAESSVKVAAITSSNTDVVTISTGTDGCYKVYIADAGTTTLTYTVDEVARTIDVTIPEASEEEPGGGPTTLAMTADAYKSDGETALGYSYAAGFEANCSDTFFLQFKAGDTVVTNLDNSNEEVVRISGVGTTDVMKVELLAPGTAVLSASVGFAPYMFVITVSNPPESEEPSDTTHYMTAYVYGDAFQSGTNIPVNQSFGVSFDAGGVTVTEIIISDPDIICLSINPDGKTFTMETLKEGSVTLSAEVGGVTYIFVFNCFEPPAAMKFRYSDSNESYDLSQFPTEIGKSYSVVFQGDGKDLKTTTIELSKPGVLSLVHNGDGVYTVTIQGAGEVDLSYSGPEVSSGKAVGTITIPPVEPEEPEPDDTENRLMFHYDEETTPRDMSQFPTAIGQTYSLYMFCNGQQLNKGTFTSSDSNVVECLDWAGGPIGLLHQFRIAGSGTTTLTYTDETAGITCSVEIVIPEAGSAKTLTFHYDTNTVRRDMSQFPTEPGQYNLYMFYGDQQLDSGTFTSSDTNVLECLRWSGGPIGLLYQFRVVGTGTTTLTYTSEAGDVVCPAQIVISEPPADVGAAYVGDYVIGFSAKNDDIFSISEYDGRFGYPYGLLPSNEYLAFHTFEIAAATKRMVDGNTVVYDRVDSNNVSLKINKTWIEVVEDDQADGSTLSFSKNGLVREMTSYNDCTVQLFMKQGYTALAKVFAEVEVTVGAETQTVTVGIFCWPNILRDIHDARPLDDTVEELNEYLTELVDIISEDTMKVYHVDLAPITYSGTIVVPEELQSSQQLVLRGASEGTTTLIGSVNLNGRSLFGVSGIYFKAPEQNCLKTYDGKTTALANGEVTNMDTCTFEGYEIAVDIYRKMISLSGWNVFIDNGIAVRMDMTDSHGNLIPWRENIFARNDTAIQILGMSDMFPPYYFRIKDCDFIGNGVDFDVQCGGTFYFHRNYFGQVHNHYKNKTSAELIQVLAESSTEDKVNNVVSSRNAVVEENAGADVIAKAKGNVRWKYPVRAWAQLAVLPMSMDIVEIPYENYLTVDWGEDAQIMDADTGELLIDISAFDTQTEDRKVIEVVDKDENSICTWTFD